VASPPKRDVERVRGLARQAVELASSEEYESRRRRWRDVNERRKPDRAPVWCRPAGVWRELLAPESLECTDESCRRVEYTFRQHLYKDWVGDDHIFEPWWGVGATWECSSEHVWGLRTGEQVGRTEKGGFRYEHPVKTIEDYERVTVPSFTYNREATQRSAERMADLLGEAMPVRITCGPALGPHQGIYLERLRGMEPMLNDLAFHPHAVHRVMARMTEGILGALRAAEDTGLLTTNHHEPMFCSDPLGDAGEGPVRLGHLWCSANSQEFQVVSPRMQEEFLLNYQIPVLQQFGAAQYGCCEDLSQKVGVVLKIPNLRIFVASYWTDLDAVIEACGATHTIMWRQSAAQVTGSEDTEPIRRHLEDGMRRLQGCHYQVVLRELETLAGHPQRLREWARLAIELAGKYA